MEYSDNEIKKLIKEAQTGNQQSFTKVYDIFFDRIYRYIFFRTKQSEEAEDLTSLVFLKVWQNLGKYKVRKNTKFSTWLFQIARFTLIDYYRKQKSELDIEEVVVASPQKIELNVEFERVKETLLELREEYQTVINLKYFDGLNHQEIAKIMGKTNVGVRVLLHRAINKLSQLIDK